MGWNDLRKAISHDDSKTANWSDDTLEVEVTQREGFMCSITAKGRLRMGPDRVFDILVSPDNYKYFSGIKVPSPWRLQSAGRATRRRSTAQRRLRLFGLQKIEHRKVLEDNGHGKMRVEVQQV